MSNVAAVVAGLHAWLDNFSFTRTGQQQGLGRDIARLAVERIRERSIQERTGFGTAWPPNSETPSRWAPEGYRAWKLKHYDNDEPNTRTGQMLSQTSLYGRTKIEPKIITLIYGTDTPPVRSQGGSPTPAMFARDQKVTDVFKAYLAHTGQSQKRIVRPFYRLEDDDGIAIRDLCVENLTAYVNATNAAHGIV